MCLAYTRHFFMQRDSRSLYRHQVSPSGLKCQVRYFHCGNAEATLAVVGDEAESDHIGQAIHSQFAGDVGTVMLHGARRNAQSCGHFFIGLALDHKFKQLAFTGGESRQSFPRVGQLLTLPGASGIERQRAIDQGQEGVGVHRLGANIDGAKAYCAKGGRNIHVGRDDDGGNFHILGAQPLENVLTGHARQIEIEDQTRGVFGNEIRQEFFTGSISNCATRVGVQHALQGVAHFGIAINDIDCRATGFQVNLHLANQKRPKDTYGK